MTNCTSLNVEFPACRKRRVTADFCGGHITSNGGVVLLRQADRLLGLTASVARGLHDGRQRGKVEHDCIALLRQRVYALALGYEDVNDHAALRHDLALQTAAGRDRALASPSTLSRFDNAAGRDWAWSVHEVMVETFIASFDTPPEDLTLDFDATDDAVHGRQEGRFFHGYYDHYCFLPLYVFCGERLLVSYLRPSRIDGAKHAWAILGLLVKKLRQAWPEVGIVLRGDSGFCRHKMLDWCDSHGVGYIVGLAKNKRLNRFAAPWMDRAAAGFAASGDKQRLFGAFAYAAGTWKTDTPGDRPYRARPQGRQPALHRHQPGRRGPRPLRHALLPTRRHGEPHKGTATRSLRRPHQLPQMVAQPVPPAAFQSLAYTLLETIRRVALKGTGMARAQAGTIRLKLLKIGAVILRNTRRVRFHLGSACPDKALFMLAAARLKPG